MSKLKIENQNPKLFERIHEIVKKIPRGKVVTYGEISRFLGTRDVRKIGFALHANRDQKIPCHRVVNKDGRLAPGYAFGGPNEQKSRLLVEGVNFVDESHVDLSKSLWNLTKPKGA